MIFSKTFDEHLCRTKIIFDKLQEAGLKLRLEKCHFAKARTSYVGYVISADGISPDQQKEPRDVSGVKSFLGLASYYRKFIANFARIANPLNELLKKNVKFFWSDQCRKSFTTLQQAHITAPVLMFPDFSQPFLLPTDASGIGLGVVLAQEVNNEEHPIAYASRTLKPAEQNYPVFEQEALTVPNIRDGAQSHRLNRSCCPAIHPQEEQSIDANRPLGVSPPRIRLRSSTSIGKSNRNADALSRICCQGAPSQNRLTPSPPRRSKRYNQMILFVQWYFPTLQLESCQMRPTNRKYRVTIST